MFSKMKFVNYTWLCSGFCLIVCLAKMSLDHFSKSFSQKGLQQQIVQTNKNTNIRKHSKQISFIKCSNGKNVRLALNLTTFLGVGCGLFGLRRTQEMNEKLREVIKEMRKSIQIVGNLYHKNFIGQ